MSTLTKVTKRKSNRHRERDSIIAHIVLIIIAVFESAPLIIMLLNSFRTDKAIKRMPVSLPETFEWQNYVKAWTKGGYTTAYINTILIGVLVACIVLLLGGMAAYSMAKLNLPKREFFIGYFTMAMAIPGFLCMVPVYFVMAKMGLANTRIGISLVYMALFMPLNTMMMRTYLIGIPRELEEAGKIDGCSEFGVFLRITLPLASPIITTVALLVFANCWNEFTWANIFLTSDNMKTVSARFFNFVSEHSSDASMNYTCGVISIAPIAILYLLLQDNFIEGLTAGGVKG